MDIQSDRQKGMSCAEIARKYHIDPRTAKKYAESDIRPVYSLTDSKPSKLDPYKEQIVIWLEELEQAVGRARLLRHPCTVNLFSMYPLSQANLIPLIELIPFNSGAKRRKRK